MPSDAHSLVWILRECMYRFDLAPGFGRAGSLDLARPPAVRKGPVSVRVASPQISILRWEKMFRGQKPWGVYKGGKRETTV